MRGGREMEGGEGGGEGDGGRDEVSGMYVCVLVMEMEATNMQCLCSK